MPAAISACRRPAAPAPARAAIKIFAARRTNAHCSRMQKRVARQRGQCAGPGFSASTLLDRHAPRVMTPMMEKRLIGGNRNAVISAVGAEAPIPPRRKRRSLGVTVRRAAGNLAGRQSHRRSLDRRRHRPKSCQARRPVPRVVRKGRLTSFVSSIPSRSSSRPRPRCSAPPSCHA